MAALATLHNSAGPCKRDAYRGHHLYRQNKALGGWVGGVMATVTVTVTVAVTAPPPPLAKLQLLAQLQFCFARPVPSPVPCPEPSPKTRHAITQDNETPAFASGKNPKVIPNKLGSGRRHPCTMAHLHSTHH